MPILRKGRAMVHAIYGRDCSAIFLSPEEMSFPTREARAGIFTPGHASKISARPCGPSGMTSEALHPSLIRNVIAAQSPAGIVIELRAMNSLFRLLLLLALLAACGMPADAAPARVISLNLCADQLLLALADPAEIAGLSRFAADAAMSAAAEQAKAFPVVRPSAEDALSRGPDLILAGPYDRPVLSGVLARQGIAVAVVDLWRGFEAGEANIAALAERLGHPDRGAALVAAIEAARHRLAGAGSGRSALVMERGGYVQGPASIDGALLGAAGLRNLAGEGSFGRFVPLEKLLGLQPDILILTDAGTDSSDRGAAFLRHPALRDWMRNRKVIRLPPRLTACPGPALVEAMDRLGTALR